jgi:asparagine synthase (glutamine-hydrolysing)
MCGIAGMVAAAEAREDQLLRASDQMITRGPDSGGVKVLQHAGFAFRRLAIIDLSPEGNQPMSNETGDVWVVFNGEIYNYQPLRSALLPNHQFRSRTDSEVVVHGYEEWGFEELLRRIDGMFAIALWDQRTGNLFLARDRIGKKPLYFAETRGGVAFASTLNALRELLPEKPSIDYAALDEYLVYQAVPAPRTIFQGISMLPPASYAQWSSGVPPVVRRYWDLSYAHKVRRREADLLEELDTLVRAAVERRLISDVPLGAFLSGGVDSSLIVAIMTHLGVGPVEAVNLGFAESEFDERPYARAVANRWKAHLHEHEMRPDEVQNLPGIVWHYGQPLADVSIVPTFAVARAARQHVTVVLNGDGGDEAFAGYARPIVARAAQTVRGLGQPIAGAAARAARLGGKKGRMLAQASRRTGRESFTYDRGFRCLREDIYSPDLLRRLGESNPDRLYSDLWESADGPTDADRALYGDLRTYLPDQLLVKMDVSTMAHSVEARSPLLDTRLLEFAATIPVEQLTKGYRTKYLLKRLAERYVPREVLYRRKRGFVMPASRWLREDLAPFARVLLSERTVEERGYFRPKAVTALLEEHLSGQSDWGDQLWTLIVLEVWHRLFVDGSLTATSRLEDLL